MVMVCAAVWAQSGAIWPADWIDREGQQQIISNDRGQIDHAIFRVDKFCIGGIAFVKSEQVNEISFKRLWEFIQAAAAFGRADGGNFDFHQDAFLGAAEQGAAFKIGDHQVIRNLQNREIEIEFAGIPGRFVGDKSDINSERKFGGSHNWYLQRVLVCETRLIYAKVFIKDKTILTKFAKSVNIKWYFRWICKMFCGLDENPAGILPNSPYS